jgi:antitoxin FitA
VTSTLAPPQCSSRSARFSSRCSAAGCCTGVPVSAGRRGGRDVPEDAVRTMKIRAAQSGQSLQAYLRSLIEREAARPTVAEAVEQARRQATADISTTDILAAIDEGRTGR